MATESKAGITTTQVYEVYIKASPQAIWDAITSPEWTVKYAYRGAVEYDDFTPGAAFRVHASEEFLESGAPDVIIDGEVLEVDPPRRMVQTWRMLMDPDMAKEGFTRLTYEIDPREDGSTKLTVIHELDDAPKLAVLVGGGSEDQGAGGGHAWILSDLKTLLETGARLAG